MHDTPFLLMETALKTEAESPHPTHKVGALISGTDANGDTYKIARSNFWPPLLEKHIGRDQKLGNASTTVHAEISVLFQAPATEGSALYVTDLPCPNCAKVVAEARLKTVYIDDHTHHTPLGQKMKPYFEMVSLPILDAAGIEVFELNTQKRSITPLATPSKRKLVPIERPVQHIPLESAQVNEQHFLALVKEQPADIPFASCYAKSSLGNYVYLCATAHRSIGLTAGQAMNIEAAQDKYTPYLKPLNRLLLTASRYGLKIDDHFLYSSQVPTSREFVNLIGAGYTQLRIGDKKTCRDEWGIQALSQITNTHILDIL